MTTADKQRSEPQLLRLPYKSVATGNSREFLLYLPAGYSAEQDCRWPVILFLHGGGERGNGLDDLDYVLHHGPLSEAWICQRNLPFIMIAPQLPTFNMREQVQMRAAVPKPVRLAEPPPPRPEERTDRPMIRAADPVPALYGITEAWGDVGFPGGWQLCQEDLIVILDSVLETYHADPDRVYLTGLSYGGHGVWHMAITHPKRWAAVAPICGDANHTQLANLAKRQLPIWMFHGGRDSVIKAEWAYDLANALESAGHTSVRFTVHEDLGHDCWTRVYGGQDLYDWFLRHKRV